MLEVLALVMGAALTLALVIFALAMAVGWARKTRFANAAPEADETSPGGGHARARSAPGIRFDTLGPRLALVGGLALTMSVPLSLVDGLVDERHGLYRTVLYEIAQSWGRTQALRGPMLVVPFVERHVKVERIRDDEGKLRTVTTPREVHLHAVVLPEQLDITAGIEEHYRARGIYSSLVYRGDLKLTGRFRRPDIAGLSENVVRIDWDQAYLSVGLSDPRAINRVAELQWDHQRYRWSPGARVGQVVVQGFHAPLELGEPDAGEVAAATEGEGFDFTIDLTVAGSGGLYFAPVAERTRATIESAWPHPSFDGEILPNNREIGADGFRASWDIPHLARGYPQLWVLERGEVVAEALFTTGVKLFEPVFIYSMVERAVKHGLLIVIVTYLGLFVFELAAKTRLHAVQYALVGLALALFYLTLLSLSEHVDFVLAYTAAAGIAAVMIASYVGLALGSWRSAGVVLALLCGLYAMLYSLLKLEDYALLMGTVLLLALTGVLMLLTRKTARPGSNAPTGSAPATV